MTRHTAHAVTKTGRVNRVPFASMPTAVALRWVAAHPEERVKFIPALPNTDPAVDAMDRVIDLLASGEAATYDEAVAIAETEES
jgi:hypothetical protein